MYKEFQAKGYHADLTDFVTVKCVDSTMAVCAFRTGPVYITKQQCMEFYGLSDSATESSVAQDVARHELAITLLNNHVKLLAETVDYIVRGATS